MPLRESAKGKDTVRERDMESAAHEAVGLEGRECPVRMGRDSRSLA